MPHFFVETNGDGTIHRVLCDGEPYDRALSLEQAFSIVTIYFRMAASNLSQMSTEGASNVRRCLGLQSFLMSLTGLEAFTNTFFHLRALELGNDAMVRRIGQSHGSLSRRIDELIEMTPDGPLRDHALLIERVFELSQLRNEIVHPRWEPSALTLAGEVPVIIQGLVQNRQALFENEQLCREALLWCLLVVARIAQARGNEDVGGFMFHWTGNYGLSLGNILDELGLPPDN